MYKTIKKLNADTSYVVVTIVEVKRSVPQEVGAKMLVTQACNNMPLSGTIGGGKVEKEAISYAQTLLSDISSVSHLKKFHLTKDLKMACGGEMTIFFEVVRNNRWNIAIFGAGHVSQKLVRVLKTLNCHIHCFDSREEWLEKLPKSKKISKYLIAMNPEKVESFQHQLPVNCFYLVMTHSQHIDFQIAKKIVNKDSDIQYLGIMGSKSKAKNLKDKLLKLGVSEKIVSNIYSPVGLAIGDNTPSEIAISITAQLLEVRA